MKALGIVIGVTTTLVTLCIPAPGRAATRARFRAETVLNDASVRISAGFQHACQVNEDGTARCWGVNSTGQLGDGTISPSSTPVPVSGLTNAVAISAGRFHTCALLADGTIMLFSKVVCWGAGTNGQLGNGGLTDRLFADSTAVGLNNAIAVATGNLHSCALLADGTARCWGANSNGALGNGTTTRIDFAGYV